MSSELVEPGDFFNYEEDELSRIGSGFAGELPCRYDPEFSRIDHRGHREHRE
jgi:hypothetical protein